MLQIVDLASNFFSGSLPEELFLTMKAMMEDRKEMNDHIKFKLQNNTVYYQDSKKKNLRIELVKILTVFTSIDFLDSNFWEPMPDVIRGFKELHVLNLSHNAIFGPILSSLENLS